MPPEALVGAVAGLVIGFVISAAKSSFTQTGPFHGEFDGMGCFATLALYAVMAVIGGVIGLALGGG